jgi:hypothetical protein
LLRERPTQDDIPDYGNRRASSRQVDVHLTAPVQADEHASVLERFAFNASFTRSTDITGVRVRS